MKFSKLIQLLLSLLIMVTMLTSTAQAALKAVGPTDGVTSLPLYYQDHNNLALATLPRSERLLYPAGRLSERWYYAGSAEL
jgi:hypothetical protein